MVRADDLHRMVKLVTILITEALDHHETMMITIVATDTHDITMISPTTEIEDPLHSITKIIMLVDHLHQTQVSLLDHRLQKVTRIIMGYRRHTEIEMIGLHVEHLQLWMVRDLQQSDKRQQSTHIFLPIHQLILTHDRHEMFSVMALKVRLQVQTTDVGPYLLVTKVADLCPEATIFLVEVLQSMRMLFHMTSKSMANHT